MKRFLNNALLIISVFFLVSGYRVEIKNNTLPDGKEIVLEEEEEKLVFETPGCTISAESASGEIAEKVNEAGEYVSVAIELDDEFDALIEEPDQNVSIEEAQRIVKEHRENVKAHYTKTNERLVRELGLGFLEAEVEISRYSNFVFLKYGNKALTDYHIEQFKSISKNERINKVYIRSENQKKNRHQELYPMKIKTYVEPFVTQNPDYDGSGITVGMIDVGIIDKKHPNFSQTDYLIRNVWWYWESVHDHATSIGLTIAGSTGIAPGARLLVAEYCLSWSDAVEWMLDNGANIINISMSNGSSPGTYTSHAAYLDYIIRNNSVAIIGSAGNRGSKKEGGDHKVTSPKTGFNVISVGATSWLGEPLYYSSHLTSFLISKPNLSAPAELIYFPGIGDEEFGGTSYAAACVSGISALIMQSDSRYIIVPHLLGAVLAATATPSVYASEFDSSGYESVLGAGIVNCELAVTNRLRTVCFYNDTNKKGQTILSHQVRLEGNKRVKICFYSLVNSDKSTTIKTTDYDLYLKKSDGTTVAASRSSYSNTELIDVIISTTGYYYIQIVQYADKKTTLRDYCSYSYCQFDPDFNSWTPTGR